MKRKKINCAICGGELKYEESSEHYVCTKCNASHSTDLFTSDTKKVKKYRLKRLRVLIAILAACYLFYWLLRIIWYRT